MKHNFGFEIPGMNIFADLMFNKGRVDSHMESLRDMYDSNPFSKFTQSQMESLQAILDVQGVFSNAMKAGMTRNANLLQETMTQAQIHMEESTSALNDSQAPELRLADNLDGGANQVEKLIEDNTETGDIAIRAGQEITNILTQQWLKNMRYSANYLRNSNGFSNGFEFLNQR
ncbi:MAG: hypothetical protein AB8B77_07245 [Alphaproteobacteria bacterium]